ncbi:hypothetical protein OZN62_10765 [Aurantiacibacter sp. MUD11]|uniref:hypothetical protein n=1 Tax=Aurantiacibacter sp. MUD11 TaxID=3003265 RepID=UPI0022AAF588|nr:hypothetical protein [Aurantiacibacter sp. MUD11]WAT17402.1 hypothetical protein OZN62_10765 [Aurantiacibacter sp. MUD11]
MKKWIAAAVLAASVMNAGAAQAQGREPSLYLRCDGEPNNMTGGEQFARFLGAITLLGIFAPSPESPDPDARLFGGGGVDACTQLIDGEDGEGNPVRRVPLILARALHYVEMRNYEAALADVARARAEAAAADLIGNPYFDRSMGLSFNNIEAAVHLRMGNPERARDVSLSSIADMRYSFVPGLYANDFGRFLKDMSPEAEIRNHVAGQIMPQFLLTYAGRLDEVGRFDDSAKVYEAFITVVDSLGDGPRASAPYARAAIAHALGGNWEAATEWADRARSNMNHRIAEGQPEDNSSSIVELLDLFTVLQQANDGDVKAARRMYSARSQWTVPSFGSVLEVNRLLSRGAQPDELIGALSQTADELWQQRYDELMAIELQDDTENDDLFDLIVDYAKVDEFEDRARNTHRVERSRMITDEPDEDGHYAITATGSIQSAIDSIVLHAALQAQHRGKQGFTMLLTTPQPGYGGPITIAFVQFVDPGEDNAHDILFIPAADVIAELGEVIPTRDEVRARERERRRNR